MSWGSTTQTRIKKGGAGGDHVGDDDTSCIHVDSFGLVCSPYFPASYKPPLYAGCKMFWAHRPDYPPGEDPGRHERGLPNIWGWLRHYFPDDPYAKQLLAGLAPRPVGGSRGLRWPTLAEWDALWETYCVPNHFHILMPGDVYVIRRKTLHLFRNAKGVSASLTCDVLYDWYFN